LGWSVTATTIYCDAVDDEVTVLVYKDGSVKCTGFRKYTQPSQTTARQIKAKSRRTKRTLACEGELCARVIQYRDKLFAEEAR